MIVFVDGNFENKIIVYASTFIIIIPLNLSLKEVSLLSKKVALLVEFQGQTNTQNASGYFRTCVTLNGSCSQELQKDDFTYQGKSILDVKKSNSKSYNLFKTTIQLIGYKLDIVADITHQWSFVQQNIKTDTQSGISQGITASVSVNAYGELSLIGIIKIKAGVTGYIFKGSINDKLIFAYDKPSGSINIKKYLITLDFQIQTLTMDVYAQYSNIQTQMVRKCLGSGWFKVCADVPELVYSDWKDIYRKSYQLAKSLNTNVIFRIKSKCYN